MVRRRLSLFLAVGLCLLPTLLSAQVNVLFVGNSYTEVNSLPQMTASVARSMGFEMVYSSNTPGGCTFSQHCVNQSIDLIRQGGWDIVVLQEQSQYPSFPQEQVEAEVFPYAARLVEAVYAASPCAEPMFYMTWGRRDGDAMNAQFFPVLGTYEGMDSMLYERYVYMAEANDASVCPVGRVWRALRERHPEIELYQSDGSHPSTAGTYAAACAFAVMFFQGDPLAITFIPDGLAEDEALTIREAVSDVVFRQDRWRRPQPRVDILSSSADGFNATFTLRTVHADSLFVDFGDGEALSAGGLTGGDTLLSHTYLDSGNFRVTVAATRHCMADTATDTLHVAPTVSVPSILREEILSTAAEGDISIIALDGRTYPYSALRTGNLPAGIYIIRVKAGDKVIQAKVIKL